MEKELYMSLLIVGITILVVFFVIPFIKKIALHINAMDIPNNRSVHKKPIPRLGGLGVYVGFLLGYMLFGKQSLQMNSILIGSFIILLTGIFDDIKPIRALPKLIGQIFAAAVIVFYGEILLTNITVFGLDIHFGIFSSLITIVFLVTCMNIINLIDGLDGLAGGISAIFYLTIIVICFCFNRFNGLEFTLALVMFGSSIGFLFHNFYPAKIFMGDSGSLFFGFMIGVISLLGYKTTVVTTIFIPLMVLAVPILDTLFAIVRRLLKHEHIYEADKEHLHHQLLKKNFSHRNTVLFIYGINILFSIASILYTLHDTADIFIGRIIYMVLIAIVLWLVLTTNIITDRKNKKGKE